MKSQKPIRTLLVLAAFALATAGCSAINNPDDPQEPSGSGGSGGTGMSTTTTSSSMGCTTTCPDLDHATGECVNNVCEYTCEAGFDDCDMDLASATSNGCEADLMSDPTHCNACTTACDPGDLCTAGMCHCPVEPGMAQFNATGTGNTGMIQPFAVPDCVTQITVEAFGAQGGAGTDTRGARMKGTFAVAPGEVLSILVGHVADMTNSALSGGGGTFVVDASNQPLVIAAGGGSCFQTCPPPAETVGRINTAGGTAGGAPRADNGQGGFVMNGTSGGGGGLTGNGANPTGGKAFVNGGLGGLGETFGGFGGGGARLDLFGQGGGGGYSGGSCGDTATAWFGCGGGGSFNTGTNPDNTPGVQMGDGLVIITW